MLSFGIILTFSTVTKIALALILSLAIDLTKLTVTCNTSEQ